MASPVSSELAGFVRSYLEGHQNQMLAALEALVRAESPTDAPETQAEVQALLSRLLRTLDYRVVRLPGGAESG